MENQPFDVLENKINLVLQMVDRLKKENLALKRSNEALQTQVSEKNHIIERLQSESQNVNDMKSELSNYRENQDRIRSKVENLLDKLKEFEEIQ